MTQGVKVEVAAILVGFTQKVVLQSSPEFFRVFLRFVEPLLPGNGQVRSEHFGHRPSCRQRKHTRLGRILGDVATQFSGEVRLNVLPGVFSIFGVAGLAGNVGTLAVKEQACPSERPQFIGP